jgi:pimeloyl-ACP methyl ester carboxylesterase
MAFLARPGGVDLAWNEEGEGPLVVLANQFFGVAETFDALLGDLTPDHRVVTYNLRGTGDSTRRGPYDIETDTSDFEAVAEAAGSNAVALAFADGCNRAVRVAVRRPDLIRAVVSPAGNPVGLAAVDGTDALAASASVLSALVEMMGTDYRGALRTMFTTANPDWDEDAVRRRVALTVDFLPQEAALPRIKSWIADDPKQASLALGDRLWLLEDGSNPWFPIEVARRTRALLPEAHILEVEDGAISRPDIAAGIVRRLTASLSVGARVEDDDGPR